MKIAAFICELNPLHEGHRYFISEARRTSGADCLIAVMSGDYVQRGEPAVMSMHERARAALEAGADLILELPAACATSSAEFFAAGGVRLLHSLGCVDTLCFGTECGDSALLYALSDFLWEHDEQMQPLIREYLAAGQTYAAARTRAAAELMDQPLEGTADLMHDPNNQLALAYLHAIRKTGSRMNACMIPRDFSFESSSRIRARMRTEESSSRKLLFADDFSLLLRDRLLRMSVDDLSCIADITPDLAHRIVNRKNDFKSWSQFTDLLHTKEMTRARISRCLCHILLGIKKGDCQTDPPFIRVLGFKRASSALFTVIRESSSLPLATSLPVDAQDYAADLYQSVFADKYSCDFIESHRQPVIVI